MHRLLAVLSAAFLLPVAALAAPVTAPTVVYQLNNWLMTITTHDVQERVLAPGESFSIDGSWSTLFQPGTGPCPRCATQSYLAGLSGFPAQVNIFNPFDNPLGRIAPGSGDYSALLTAPTTAGTYYIGGAFSLDFVFQPNMVGSANSSNQVSYIITVADPAAVPEPGSLAAVSAALAGLLVATRRSRRQA